MILGEKVTLKLMEEKDVEYKVRWVNDPEIRSTLIFDYISETQTKKWLTESTMNDSRRDYIICVKNTDKPIGFTSLKNIDRQNLKAEMTLCIGDKEYWGKGYAIEARTLMLHYAFIELNLNKVYTYNSVQNKAILHINKKLGFRIEGTLRQHQLFQGKFLDFVIMGLIKDEWSENISV